MPTTRALSLVTTGEPVMRDMFYDGHPAPEPGAIVCRVAPSFLRFGNFELPASRGDEDTLRALVRFTLKHFYPHRLAGEAMDVAGFFADVAERTAAMVVGWMRVGFVHGVMNTDNLSVLGHTMDYGPYGWIEPYDPGWTPNTTDAQGRRYRFGNQPTITRWNLLQLARALALLVDDVSVEKIKEMIPACRERFVRFEYRHRENRGLSATLNEGIDFACGAVVGFCSSDDAFHQRKISAQVEYFNENQDSDFCFTSTYVFDDNSQILPDAPKLANRNLSGKVTFKDLFTFKVSFPVRGAYRARFIKDVLSGFDESLSAEDYDINLKIIRNTKVGYIEDKLYYYRSPPAIGGARNRPVMRLDVSQSHRRTIEKYRDDEIYKEAL